jgi:ABC-type multidrug transport system fused ATPase/permease subunit
LVTRNHLLANYAREFCVQRRLLKEREEGPVITQRRLAALLWLTLGAQERQELTRRQLLVACERVTQIRPELIEGAMRKLKRVRETDLPKLEALLTQPRSAQLLLDLTMNRQEVITDDNIEEILDMMRKTTASEVRDQAREESKKAIEEIRLNTDAEVERQREHSERLTHSLAAKESALSDARALLDRREGADIQMLQRWAEEAANFERRVTKAEQLTLVVLAGVLAAGGWLLDTDAMPTYAATIAYVVAILTFLFAKD